MAFDNQNLLQYTLNTQFSRNKDWAEVGERFYFLVGSALAAQKDWNKMTLLQLEHEARVQGFLGPFEEHNYSAIKLRIKLACEAARVENEARDLANERFVRNFLPARTALENFVAR